MAIVYIRGHSPVPFCGWLVCWSHLSEDSDCQCWWEHNERDSEQLRGMNISCFEYPLGGTGMGMPTSRTVKVLGKLKPGAHLWMSSGTRKSRGKQIHLVVQDPQRSIPIRDRKDWLLEHPRAALTAFLVSRCTWGVMCVLKLKETGLSVVWKFRLFMLSWGFFIVIKPLFAMSRRSNHMTSRWPWS